jgi:hypothetical protein
MMIRKMAPSRILELTWSISLIGALNPSAQGIADSSL